ncbi:MULTISPECIES: DUF1624 domain-containing protein [unclassified Acinetobacter]|uniref:DUF1624 domain-containing protein n=1 Tax=unclassified Acinetobacter TaxID=196816 RepID=UPI00293495BB|nr:MULTISPECIES: heparan-alpha-glucosaminide N-acetyltransferase domain-containing protein [unclassified Acinetobacter]WOE33122.1 heparan-alpha-glucosaminide N-acetyltransferase domain-containing protein [Acinetobacter sp. SAAs470]WOE39788.1 heparan-alpha-glucosaminide N-acetyltransferase domain-containing protein [Acinetobacter sp. SAAs474]
MAKINNQQRLQSIDALRGFVIMIMLVDHVRETFYMHKQVSDPMSVSETEPLLFWSRILAHLCAPIFVLLTGISAYLYQMKVQNLAQTRAFLLKRGIFLILLELTLVNFAWTATFPPQTIYLQVIWAIGLSMVILALCIGFSKKWLLLFSLVIIFGHNLLDMLTFKGPLFFEHLWFILHEKAWIEFESLRIRTTYPVLPWIGVILLGYCLGQLFEPRFTPQQRDRYLCAIGIASIGLFIILRMINQYGDHPWLYHDSFALQVMSFFNLTKYPPSLFFILFNAGIGLIILVLFQRYIQHKIFKPLIIFGSVPMFFYLLHLYVLKLCYALCFAIWGNNHGNYFAFNQMQQVWMMSVVLILLLYPAVTWFSVYKHSHKQYRWLKYF